MDNPLVGKVITNIDLANDRMAIRFSLNDGTEVIARCDADCCSQTWIEDVLNPDAAIGSEVVNAFSLELPEEFQTPTKTENYEEEMQYYGFAIETAKGRFTLAYRNSSNGYYGGWLSWPEKASQHSKHYGGVYGQNNSAEEWKPIQEN